VITGTLDYCGAHSRDLCLTVRQPWVHFTFDLPSEFWKCIENRETWAPTYRGRIWIHAAKAMTRGEYWDGVDFVFRRLSKARRHIGRPENLPRGVIVGSVDLVDVIGRGGTCLQGEAAERLDRHPKASSPWYTGDYGFVLRNPVRLLAPVPLARGERGRLFRLPDDVLAKLREAA
jgi:hypothetical protein